MTWAGKNDGSTSNGPASSWSKYDAVSEAGQDLVRVAPCTQLRKRQRPNSLCRHHAGENDLGGSKRERKKNGEDPPMPAITELDARLAVVWTGVSLASTVLHLAAEPGGL
jgi:hypothetical protein